jgi:putative membrane protein
LIPWAGIIFLILYLIIREGVQHVAGKTTPEDILNEGYAKGELTREQYMQMKEDIKSSTGG